MAANMEWSPDFCLSCDRQISEGGAYCSQACRLADLEKAGTIDTRLHSHLSSSASSTSSSNGFFLPPAVNFSAYKTASQSRAYNLSSSTSSASSYYFSPANVTPYSSSTLPASTMRQLQLQPQPRMLSPSSSRSSLSSASSQSQTPLGISAHAASQLDNYVRSFDQVRELKRRLS